MIKSARLKLNALLCLDFKSYRLKYLCTSSHLKSLSSLTHENPKLNYKSLLLLPLNAHLSIILLGMETRMYLKIPNFVKGMESCIIYMSFHKN